MKFLKAVILALLVNVVAPIVVHYVESKINHSTYEVRHDGGKPVNARLIE
ncbi:TPA: hypothetical protein ACGQ50_000843 [Enterobacter cloacae]